MYHYIFADSQGYSASRIYYAQLMGVATGKFWDGSAMVTSPTYADTVIATVNLADMGMYGITVSSEAPYNQRYKIIVRQRADGTPANTDPIVDSQKVQVLFDGKVRLLNMNVDYG